ncbi:unnamed protein product [Ilex paraguariensis]|uniref:S-acyltransferase n=1 Tax=Ilex paraguariensis TaxID=185542 RepID=A0ABC8S7U5_9AQUA
MARRHGWELPAHTFQNVYEYVAVGVYSFLALCVFVLYVRCRAIDPADPEILIEAAETPAYGLQNDTDLRGIASSPEEPSKARLENGGKSDRCGSSGCSKIVGLVCGFSAWEYCRKDEDLFAQQTGEEDALFCTLCNAEVRKFGKHCKSCDKCVDGFDHHCRWLNNCVGRKNYITFVCLMAVSLGWLVFEFGVGIAVLVRCFTDRKATENQITDRLGEGFSRPPFATVVALCTAVSFLATVPLGELFFFHVILIRKGITTYEYVVAMRTQSEAPGPSVDGGDLQSLPSSPTSSAMSGRSSLGMSLQYKGAWCTPPRIFMDHQDEIIPHLERDRLPSTVDPDSLPPPDKGKRLAQRPVRISAWKLAKLDSNESIKAGAKARASSSVLRPVSSRHHPYDSDHLSNSNVSGRSSPTSTNHGFHERNTRAGTSRLSSSKSSYPPSRASREDNEMCGHNISNLNSPHPPNLTPSPLEQLASNRDHFNPMYMSSVDRSPLSAKDANETAVSDVERVPMSRNLGAAENSRSSSVFWDQEAGRFVSAATRSVSSSSQVSGREPLTYAGQSIFYGGSPVDEQLSRGTRTGNSLPSDPERGSTSSYYRQGRSQRGGQLPVFVPSDSQHHQFSSTLR